MCVCVCSYEAKLFRDDATAAAVNAGEELIDWNGVLVDKFDVRYVHGVVLEVVVLCVSIA